MAAKQQTKPERKRRIVPPAPGKPGRPRVYTDEERMLRARKSSKASADRRFQKQVEALFSALDSVDAIDPKRLSVSNRQEIAAIKENIESALSRFPAKFVS